MIPAPVSNIAKVFVRPANRGLFTRVPAESSDMVRSGDSKRISTVAENVRFANGVISNALGYDRALLQVTSGEPPASVPYAGDPVDKLHQARLISSSDPTPLFACAGERIYKVTRSYDSVDGYVGDLSEVFDGSAADRDFPWHATDFYDSVLFAQAENVAQYWANGSDHTLPIPGLPSSEAEFEGVESFFGHTLLWREDVLKWSDKDDFTLYLPVATTVSSAVLTVATDYTQPAAGSSVTVTTAEDPVALDITVGQYVMNESTDGGDTFYTYYEVTGVTDSPTYTVTLKRLDLTGGLLTGETVSDGTFLFTVDANASGETRVVGSGVNGRILRVMPTGDYAYIFKSRSILSMQYVGVASGTFYIHPEVQDEGLLAARAITNLGDGRLVFVGHREIYSYSGGAALVPVCQQASREMFASLDRSALYKLQVHHHEQDNEVWVVFPVVGGSEKVLIWNYVEDTATIDKYSADLGGISAMAAVDWPIDTPWRVMYASWEDTPQAWQDFVSTTGDRITLIATRGVSGGEDPALLLWGTGFYRESEAGVQEGYVSKSETQVFDFGMPDNWKYVQVVKLGLDIKAPDNAARLLYVQVGQQADLAQVTDGEDTGIVWTDPVAVDVSGNPLEPVKVNPGGAGRYLRLRFYSEDPLVSWRISSFEIVARVGGTY